MEITIADTEQKHAFELRLVLNAVVRETKFLAWTESPSLSEMRALVMDNVSEGNPQIVALDDGKVIGWCDILKNTRPTMLHCGSLGMGLLPEYRSKGIGTKLVTAILQRAAECGLHRVELEVFEDNAIAIALYRKVGFKEEGIKVDAVKIEDKYFNLLSMAILL